MYERGTILLVDDNEGIRLTMGRILGSIGYRVFVAEDGRAAVTVGTQGGFDVALIDYKMNGMDGVETCASLRKLNNDASLYIVTAHMSTEMEAAAMANGATGVIHKPVDVPVLLELLDQRVRGGRAPSLVAAGGESG